MFLPSRLMVPYLIVGQRHHGNCCFRYMVGSTFSVSPWYYVLALASASSLALLEFLLQVRYLMLHFIFHVSQKILFASSIDSPDILQFPRVFPVEFGCFPVSPVSLSASCSAARPSVPVLRFFIQCLFLLDESPFPASGSRFVSL